MLAAGRLSYAGAGFRAGAARLCDALEARVGRRPWVQPVVVIWGEFPQRRLEDNRVIYVHGSELLAWLGSRPGRLSAEDCRELGEAVVQRVGVEAPEALVEEEGLEPSATARRQLDQAEREREAGEERLAAGERLRAARLPEDAVDDPEVLREAVAAARHRAENL